MFRIAIYVEEAAAHLTGFRKWRRRSPSTGMSTRLQSQFSSMLMKGENNPTFLIRGHQRDLVAPWHGNLQR